MSDVSAVVLSMGEPFLERALDSLRRQTLPPEKTILVEKVSPFHKALNQGVSEVETPMFVQVDADMILDAECLSVLRGLMDEDVAVAVAQLRDPLLQQVVGVKLFRTACFKDGGFADSISPDTDFLERAVSDGWRRVNAHDRMSRKAARSYTLGEHRPDYTPDYTFRKFTLEAGRCRYRNRPQQLDSFMNMLEASNHEMARS